MFITVLFEHDWDFHEHFGLSGDVGFDLKETVGWGWLGKSGHDHFSDIFNRILNASILFSTCLI